MADQTHETKIVIGGDASGASNALNGIKSLFGGIIGTLGKVKTAISGVMRALGVFGMAMQGINVAIEWYKKLNDWMHRAETAAKALREELERTAYETKVAQAAASYEKLTKHLAEANRLEKERNDILEQRKRYERDLEDANAERNKQLEIAALDPNANDYAAQKKAIERRYETEASDRTAARASEDARSQAAGIYRQADQKEAEVQAKEKEWQKQDAIVAAAQEKSWAAAMKARKGGDAEKEAAKKADEEFKRQFDKAKKIREEIDATLREAQSLRNKAAELAGGNVAAKLLNDANRQRIENDAKAEEAEKKKKLEGKKVEKKKQDDLAQLDPASNNYERDKREIERTYEIKALEDKRDRTTNELDRKAAEEELEAARVRHERERREEQESEDKKKKQREQNVEDKTLEKMKQDDLAQLDPTSKTYERDKREIERTYEIKALENKRDRATNEEDRKAADEERLAAGIRHDRERLEEQASLSSELADRASSFDDVSQNRLTAMGLGSGVSSDGGVTKEMNEIITILRQQLDESRKSRETTNGQAVAVYGE